ncbi:MAG: hypothetical protein HC923_11015 [Myxococcales bacterium]|nr:hypothetical protein [Myxococcales bacterium]
MTIDNPQPGAPIEAPFTLDGLQVVPGEIGLQVIASNGEVSTTRETSLRVECAGCPVIFLEEPEPSAVFEEPVLPRVRGRIVPAGASSLRYRVVDRLGQAFDGPLRVRAEDGFAVFAADQVPLFGGLNRVEITAPGGTGDTARCATSVAAPDEDPSSVRAVLRWDTMGSDLDLILVGPGASLFDIEGVLAPGREGGLEGQVLDDVDGLGPEHLWTNVLPEGTYGLAVAAMFSEGSAVVTPIAGGRLGSERPLGPVFLSAGRGDLWLVGTVRVAAGVATFEPVDRIFSGFEVPMEPPERWSEL